MHISTELQRIRQTIMPPEPLPEKKFVSVLQPYKEENPGPKPQDELSRFELLVFRKNHLPPFNASGKRDMSFNTENVAYVKNDVESINELLRRFLKFKDDYLAAVIYDNRLPSPYRDERWIFKYDHGKVSVNKLDQYAGVRDKYLNEINSIG